MFGEGYRIDVAPDDTVWTVNNAGQAGYYNLAPDAPLWLPAGPENLAADIGCQPSRAGVVGKIGPDSTIACWALSTWDAPIPGSGTRIDVAANGDLWVVSGAGDLWQYHASEWSWRAASALDVGCGANGQVWYISTDGTIQRVADP